MNPLFSECDMLMEYPEMDDWEEGAKEVETELVILTEWLRVL